MLDSVLAKTPDDPALLFGRAKALYAWGRNHEARLAFLRTEIAGGRQDELYLYLGLTFMQTGDLRGAQKWLEKGIGSGYDTDSARCALATALARDQRGEEAKRCLEGAVADFPDSRQSHVLLGNCVLEQGDAVTAEAHFREAVRVDQTSATAWIQLAVALDRQNRAAEALDASEHAAQLERAEDWDADIFVNQAVALHVIGRTRDAIAICERNLSQRPSAHGYRTYAGILLAAGRLEHGWQFYDFRWYAEPQLSLRPDFRKPVWAGQDLRGTTILLHMEQGIGDTLQYVRYARHVKTLGATVILATSKVLLNLARSVAGVDRVMGPGEELPDFDYFIHLLTLPKVFGTCRESIPANVPYLAADPGRLREARAKLHLEAGLHLKVGLVWSGSATNAYNVRRACPLASLSPLWEVEGVRWFSLQKSGETLATGDSAADAPLVQLEMRDDLDGTAALVDSLDLVVCVDTSVAHLAGALGKPTWVLLPKAAHWTWLDEGEESPWYPTMRLFRQRVPGDWAEVVMRVKSSLEEVVRTDDAAGRALGKRAPSPPPAMLPVSVPRPGPGHRPGFSAVAETRYGILQYLPDADDEGVALPWYGEWMQGQLDVLARMLSQGSTVLEVGSGIGAHSVWLSKALGREGRLVLSEARNVEQRILRQNLAANRVENATVLRAAVAPADAAAETVDTLRLERLEWIKVQLDSDSLQILAGAAETLWRLRPNLWVAAADCEVLEQLAAIVLAYGYRCWRHETRLFNPGNFNRRNEDVFGGRRALALLAVPEEVDVDVALAECVEI